MTSIREAVARAIDPLAFGPTRISYRAQKQVKATEAAERAIAAHLAALEVEGFVVVPREPTYEMASAGMPTDNYRASWREMVKAAMSRHGLGR